MNATEWLIKNKAFLSIRAIEKYINCPTDTLQKVIQEKQNLPEKWKQPLEDFIKVLQKP
jgi:hypothetical protein